MAVMMMAQAQAALIGVPIDARKVMLDAEMNNP